MCIRRWTPEIGSVGRSSLVTTQYSAGFHAVNHGDWVSPPDGAPPHWPDAGVRGRSPIPRDLLEPRNEAQPCRSCRHWTPPNGEGRPCRAYRRIGSLRRSRSAGSNSEPRLAIPRREAFGANLPAPDNPDASEPGPKAPIHELREIAGVEFHAIARSRKLPTRVNESGFAAIRPAQSSGFKLKRGLVSARSHHVAVDRLEERLDECRVQVLPGREIV